MTDSLHSSRRPFARRTGGLGLKILASCLGLGMLLSAGDPLIPPPPLLSGEMVGTLPGTDNWNPVGNGDRNDRSRASFYVQGDLQRVMGIALGSSGTGRTVFTYLPGVGLRATFHGDVHIAMHPASFQDGLLEAGIQFGAEGGTAAVGLFQAGKLVSATLQDMPDNLHLPMGAIRASGALEDGLRIVSAVPMVGRSILRLEESAGVLSVAQSH